MNAGIDGLAQRILSCRAGMGIRQAAKEAGVSPATLSRVENGKIPDLETFGKICAWLGDDPARYLGAVPAPNVQLQRAQVHFKKGAAIEKDSAQALGEMILAVQRLMLAEEEVRD